MGTDARVEAYAVDDLSGVQALGLGIRIQLIEIGDAQRQISIGKKLYRFGFGEAHKQCVDILLERALLQQGGEGAGRFFALPVAGYNDTGGVEIVV